MILQITLESPNLTGSLSSYQNLCDRLEIVHCFKPIDTGNTNDNSQGDNWLYGTHVTITDHGDRYTVEYKVEINDQLTLKAGREIRYDAGLIDIHADLSYLRKYWLQADKYPAYHMRAYGFDDITRTYVLTTEGIGVRYHDSVSGKVFNCNKPPTIAALIKRVERARANVTITIDGNTLSGKSRALKNLIENI